MKQRIRFIAISLLALFIISGCSKEPLQEINAAKAAVDSIVSDGAEKYLPEETKKINDDLNKAMDEVKAENSKLFKNYEHAKKMLVAVKTETDEVNAKLPAKKDAAKKESVSAMDNAKNALDETKELLEKAPREKGAKEPIETISAQVKNLEDSLKELQLQVDREDFLTIASKAGDIRNKASELSILIKEIPAKKEKKKK